MEASDFEPHDWREWRRLRVLQLKQLGWRQREIASALGASEVSVSRWLARAAARALKPSSLGPPPDLRRSSRPGRSG